ncbi:MAG: hypothetical protein HS111_34895 [Kofleriaceae bacterium]|nr:hypothetical protein [Kofleriaceae bacterium]
MARRLRRPKNSAEAEELDRDLADELLAQRHLRGLDDADVLDGARHHQDREHEVTAGGDDVHRQGAAQILAEAEEVDPEQHHRAPPARPRPSRGRRRGPR